MTSLLKMLGMKMVVVASLLVALAYAGCLQDDDNGVSALCCQGRNNTCVRSGSRTRNSHGRLCYCDEECLLTGDCCTDYQDTCLPVDCQLADWTEWGNCSTLCGRGVMTRSRPVMVEPRNGGQACGKAEERLPCWGTKCKVSRHTTGGDEARETGRIIPVGYGSWRQHQKYNPYKNHLLKNLYGHYHMKDNAIMRPTYYGLYEIVRSSVQCGQEGGPEWARQLAAKTTTTICVECQPLAMRKHIGARCRGHGLPQRETRWEATTAPGCRGTWQLVSEHEEGTCNGDSKLSFIFL